MFIEDFTFEEDCWYLIQRAEGLTSAYYYKNDILNDNEYREGCFSTGDIKVSSARKRKVFGSSRTYSVVCKLVKEKEE